jgi:hypothetical protein
MQERRVALDGETQAAIAQLVACLGVQNSDRVQSSGECSADTLRPEKESRVRVILAYGHCTVATQSYPDASVLVLIRHPVFDPPVGEYS